MKILTILLVLLALKGCNKHSTTKPNVILIMADDLGYGDIGCYGNSTISTPNLDKMAGEGMLFTNYYANGPVCSPTRAALMTGNYQQRSGIEGVIYAALDKRKGGIGESQTTLGEYFQKAGYKTGIFGKWHLGYEPKYNPAFHGFDEFRGYISGNIDFISHRDQANQYDWWHNTDTVSEEGYVTDLITDHALRFMEENKENPFLIYIPHEAPHYPYQGRNDIADRLPGEKFPNQGSRKDKKGAYREMVEIMDENIGRVFDKLSELDLDNNTIVFFCSDNGANQMGSNGELRGFKGSLWEGGIRVPALAWYPEIIEGGQVAHQTVLSMDILPTLLSLAGIKSDHTFDGINFSSFWNDGQLNREEPVIWRFRNQWVVMDGKWKYAKIKNQEYLFNLSTDPGEENNLSSNNGEKVKELKDHLKNWETDMESYQLISY